MDIIARTDEFESGLFKTTKELRAARRVFERNVDEHDKYARSLNRVDEMLKRGNISASLHRREIDRLGKEYRELHTVQGRVIASLKQNFVQYGIGAITVGAFIAKFDRLRRSMAKIDELDKASKSMGATVADVQSITFLAGQTAGLTTEQASQGFQKMNKRIAEAANGLGEAKTALELLNVDAKELNKLKPYEQFLFLADAMEKVPHAGTRAALAAKLFDMEARRLHVSMKGGSKAILDMRQNAEDLGILLDEKAVKAVVDANDAIDRFDKAWEAIGMTISASVAPALEKVADRLLTIVEIVGRLKAMGFLFGDNPIGAMQKGGLGQLFEGKAGGMPAVPIPGAGQAQGLSSWVLGKVMEKMEPDSIDFFPEDKADRLLPFIPIGVRSKAKQNEQFNKRVESWQDGWLASMFGFKKQDRRKFELVKKDDDEKADALKDDKPTNLISGTTAEQNSIEEYRFLVEKQQRENQARLTTSNIEALNRNTNAILQTQTREVHSFPRRSNMGVQLAP